jgi:hypothetical protein
MSTDWQSEPPIVGHDPDSRVNARLGATYRYHPAHEALALLHEVAPEAYAQLPANLRAPNAPYIAARLAALGAGLPVGPPQAGGQVINDALRSRRGATLDHDGPAADARRPAEGVAGPADGPASGDTATTSPSPADDGRNLALGIAQALGFANPDIAVRLIGPDLVKGDDGRWNAGTLLADLARTMPGALKPDTPTGDVGQGQRGRPIPVNGHANDAMNAAIRGAREGARDRPRLEPDARVKPERITRA